MPRWDSPFFDTKCPGCGSEIGFCNNGTIVVNCETKQEVDVDGLFTLWNGCKNPFCKWSKVNAER